MYLKKVNGYAYYCMSVRRNGHVTTFYLGRSLREAKKKELLLRGELGIGGRGRPRKNEDNPRFFHEAKSQARPFIIVPIVLILSMAIIFNAGITGDIVANMSENLSQNLSSLGDLLGPLVNGSLEQQANFTFNQSGNSSDTTAAADSSVFPDLPNGSVAAGIPESSAANESQSELSEENTSETASVETEDVQTAMLKANTESRLGIRLDSLRRLGNKHIMEFHKGDARIRLEGVNPDEISEVHSARISHASLAEKTVTLGTDTIFLNSIEMESAEITLNKTGPVNAILRCTDFSVENDECLSWERTGIPFADSVDSITFNVTGFSGYAGAYITIINVQSYPTVGGEWTVAFTTEGTADLIIPASNGTTYGTSPPSDLEWLSLRCGEEEVPASFDGSQVFYENWNCSETGYQTVKVLTEGVHTQQFIFGDDVQYAHNWAKEGNVYNCSNCSDCNDAIQNASSGDIIMLNASITDYTGGTCISFGGKDNITFDCMGNTISGDNTDYDWGIYANNSDGGSHNIVIQNCPNISYFSSGIYLDSSENSAIRNSSVYDSWLGVWGYGIRVDNSDNMSLANLTIRNSGTGILLYYTSNTKSDSLNLSYNTQAVIVVPYCGNTFNSVTAGTNLPLAYYNDTQGITVQNNNSIGQLVFCNVSNSVIKNITMEHQNGIYLCQSQNNTLSSLNITYSDYGVYIYISSNNTLENSTFGYGMRNVVLDNSVSNVIRNVISNNNSGIGILVAYNSKNNSLANVTVNSNYYGISFYDSSSYNTLKNMVMNLNSYGMYIGLGSSYNTINNSRIESNTQYGIHLESSGSSYPRYNTFYNNFFNNTVNVYSNNDSSLNYWNATLNCSVGPNIIGGPCIGGNYWTSPTGNFSDTCADSNGDGICDSSYAPTINNTDYLPLRMPQTYSCVNCSDCNSKIQAAYKGDTIGLNTSVNNQAGTCISFGGKDNITFDCMGNTIDGDDSGGDYGIYLPSSSGGSNNNTIRNCYVKDFDVGIYLASSSNNSLYNINSTSNTDCGFHVFTSSSYNNFTNINCSLNSANGIRFTGGSYNTFINMTFYANGENGLTVESSPNNVITNVTSLNNSGYDIYVSASAGTDCANNFSNVTISGSYPFMYVNYQTNISNATFSELILCNASNSRIDNITIPGNPAKKNNGIIITSTVLSNLSNINVTNCREAVSISSSSNNTLTNISMLYNGQNGLYMTSGTYNSFINMRMVNGVDAFTLTGSYNRFENVTISAADDGDGIVRISNANYNIFTNITVEGSSYSGIGMTFSSSSNNTVNNSVVKSYNKGIEIRDASSLTNRFYNNIFNNTINFNNTLGTIQFLNVSLNCGIGNIIGGSCIGGNYWTSPTGNFSDSCVDSQNDGICDSPYAPNVNNTDNLPLASDFINAPFIYFVNPTDNNSAVIGRNWSYVNVSVTDAYSSSSFIDWNRSLVGWWRMDNVSAVGEGATIYDLSTYGNNATANGNAVQSTDGKFGKSYSFDGAGDYLTVPNSASLNFSNTMTVSVWHKPIQLSGWRTLVSTKQSNYLLWRLDARYSDGYPHFTINFDQDAEVDANETAIGNASLTVGQWHHLVGVYNATHLLLYMNGVLIGSVPIAASIPKSGYNLVIGSDAYWLVGTNEVNGSIDDVLLFNHSLSSDEIKSLYSAGLYRLYHNFTGLADGTYAYRAYAQDAAGNVNSTEQRTVIIDLMPPQISLATPSNNTYRNSANVNVTCNLTDNNGLGNVTLYVWNSTAIWNNSQKIKLAEIDPAIASLGSGLDLLMHLNNDSSIGENDTFFVDSSGHGYNGSNPGMTASDHIEGKFGLGVRLHGGNDNIPINMTLNPNITVSAWARLYTQDDALWAVDNGSSCIPGVANPDLWFTGGWIYLNTCDGTSNPFCVQPAGVDNWHHYVAVIENATGNTKLYVDGNLCGTAAYRNVNGTKIYIGSTGGYSWDGAVDEFAVWNRSLSAAEISDLYMRRTFLANFSLGNLSDDIYQWNCLSSDLVGNQNFSSSNSTFTIDTINPEVEFVPPTPENGTGRSFTFELNASISDINLGKVVYSWNGTNYTFYDDSLVLMYNFENRSILGENDSFVRDLSRHANSANCSGTSCPVWNTQGRHGGAMKFDGTNDYFIAPQIFSGNIDATNLTYAAWIRIDSFNQYGAVVNQGNYNYEFATVSSGGIIAWNYDSTIMTYSPASTGVWYHVALVKSGTNHTMIIRNTTDVVYYNSVIDSVPGVVWGNRSGSSPLEMRIGSAASGYYFNGTVDEVRVWNWSLSYSEIQGLYMSNLAKFNQTQWYLYVNQTNLTTGKSYDYYVWAGDLAGNANATETRTVVGNVKPGFVNMSRSPSSIDDMDPNITITVTVNISDSDNNLDSVILQWKNVSASWGQAQNSSMVNLTAKSFFTSLTASFTPTYESNYTYRVWANDTEGELNISSEVNISVFYDWTWTIDRSGLGNTVAGGFSTTSPVGSFMINNTGDFNMSFSISDNSPYDPAGYSQGCGLLFYGSCSLDFDQIVSNQSIKGIRHYNVSATFGTTTREDLATITVLANPSVNATPLYRTVNVTLASYSGGPYFDTLIDVYPPSMSHSETAVISAYLKNIGNETAQDVAINWTAPSAFGISGNLAETAGNMSPGVQNRYNLSLTANPATVAVGSYTVTFNATGHGNENISDGHSISFIVYCGQNDGICGLGCTYIETSSFYDQDCTAPAPVIITQPGIGGAAPAAAGLSEWQKQKLFQTQETYELVRSTQQEFVLKVENPFDGAFENVSVGISGFLKQYISVTPAFVSSIPMKGSSEFRIGIEAPGYFTKGKYELNFTITGVVVSLKSFLGNSTVRKLTPVREHRIVTLILHEISKEDAEKYLNETGRIITLLKEKGLNTAEMEKLLSQAVESFRSKDFERSKDTYDKAKDSMDKGLLTLSLLDEIKGLTESASRNGIGIPKTERLVMLSRAALGRGDFVTALQRTNDAKFTYALESLGVFNVIAYISNNWPALSVATAVIVLLSSLGILSVRYRLLSRKLMSLKKEEDVLLGLIKELQNDCFERGKLGMKEYFESLLQYERKMSTVVQEMVRLEIRKANMLKLFKGEYEKLLEERKKLLELIKETQSMYLDSGTLDTRIYENKMRSYAERIAEIEENIATLEAKRATKRKLWNFG